MLFEGSIQALEMAHRACVRIMSELAQTRDSLTKYQECDREHAVFAARHHCTPGQGPESPIEPGAQTFVQAQDDPAKHRIRAWLCDLNDEQLSSSLGLTSEDIAVLRSTQTLSSSRRSRWPSK
jgi:hypothetical protein